MDQSNTKRDEYISWEEYFMAITLIAAKRSKDPCRQVGACIVNNENKILGIGYNGMPLGCHDDVFSWGKNTPEPMDNKHLYVCHAEMNAVINKNSADVKGCKIFVNLFPCNECAKIIIQSGITEVVYLCKVDDNNIKYIASKRMFDAARVKYRKFQVNPNRCTLQIDFREHEEKLNETKYEEVLDAMEKCDLEEK